MGKSTDEHNNKGDESTMQVQQYNINDIIVDVVKNRCGVLYIALQEQNDIVILSTGEARRIVEIIQQEVK